MHPKKEVSFLKNLSVVAAKQFIKVVDLFAGPGGLGEGFSTYSFDQFKPFKVVVSVEKEKFEHQTLLVRTFFRQFEPADVPEIYYKLLRGELNFEEFKAALNKESGFTKARWKFAEEHAHQLELGAVNYDQSPIKKTIETKVSPEEPWVLIGGPPCQAYSLVGRSRNKGKEGYVPEDDQRHRLYLEYLRIIAHRWPAAFVMENVKGILSSKLDGRRLFEKIVSDLENPGCALDLPSSAKRYCYKLHSVVCERQGSLDSHDFIVRCEDYGIPQKRHRVIIVGIRQDHDVSPKLLLKAPGLSVEEVIGELPAIRSGVSRDRRGNKYVKLEDSQETWIAQIRLHTLNEDGPKRWLSSIRGDDKSDAVRELISNTIKGLSLNVERGKPFIAWESDLEKKHSLYQLIDSRIGGVCQHQSREHLPKDLVRYLFAACYAKIYGVSPKLSDFPKDILPEHENAEDGIFEDRFRVQVRGKPATTITSHISKDGHYYIHYDPKQCRSLTVREAARLQTFPDNYFFCGPRTKQYVQVGNAVPPMLAAQIADSLYKALIKPSHIK